MLCVHACHGNGAQRLSRLREQGGSRAWPANAIPECSVEYVSLFSLRTLMGRWDARTLLYNIKSSVGVGTSAFTTLSSPLCVLARTVYLQRLHDLEEVM